MFFGTCQLKTEELFLKLERTAAAVPGRDWADSCYFTITLTDGTSALAIQRNSFSAELYGVSPCRGNHYAGKAEYLPITCNPDNLPSRKTCEYAGGILTAAGGLPTDNEMYRQGEPLFSSASCLWK